MNPSPNLWREHGSVLRRNNWNNVWNSSSGCVTFYFKNFPDSCDVKVMYSRLNEVERVRDVFIPKWVNREGKRFGFVRFRSNIDKNRVEQELNDIWFGSYKLRANLSKFDRRSGPNKTDSHLKTISPGPSHPVQESAWRRNDISYAEAVRGSLRQTNVKGLISR
ncbi:hypothetical protein ACS0TY_027302 [Phlomoides rotata]